MLPEPRCEPCLPATRLDFLGILGWRIGDVTEVCFSAENLMHLSSRHVMLTSVIPFGNLKSRSSSLVSGVKHTSLMEFLVLASRHMKCHVLVAATRLIRRLLRDLVVRFDRHAAGQAHVRELVAITRFSCNAAPVIVFLMKSLCLRAMMDVVLLSATSKPLVIVMAKTSSSTALVFRSRATDFSSQAFKSVSVVSTLSKAEASLIVTFFAVSAPDCEVSSSRSSSYTMAQSASRTTSCTAAWCTGTFHDLRLGTSTVLHHLREDLRHENGDLFGVWFGVPSAVSCHVHRDSVAMVRPWLRYHA